MKRETVPANSRLAKSERELRAAMASQFEAFYQTGVILERIKDDKEFEDAGYTSFNKYMNERMPCGLKQTGAWQLIRAVKIRPHLPTFECANGALEWNERAIRPLTKGDFQKRRIVNIGKRIAKRVADGDVLTEKLVKEELDKYTGADKEREQRRLEKLEATETAFQVLKRFRREMNKWKKSLETVSEEFWADAESDMPGCIQRASGSVSQLASFFEGVHQGERDACARRPATEATA